MLFNLTSFHYFKGHFGVAVRNYKKSMERFRDLGCTIIPCKSKISKPSLLNLILRKTHILMILVKSIKQKKNNKYELIFC